MSWKRVSTSFSNTHTIINFDAISSKLTVRREREYRSRNIQESIPIEKKKKKEYLSDPLR
jgi:hypothetical protein